jgi:glyoxylase-like metal-dependent hydrolase (beta-lactamase superfamily II)
MNKILKRVLIITGIIIAVLVLAFVGLFMKLSSEMKDFAPMETGQVIDNISVVKDDFANLFIMQDSAQYITIDGGMNSTATAEQFTQLGINPDDVSAVFLTHTDSDHVGALSVFKNAKVYLSKAEMLMINGERTKFVRLFGSVVLPDDYILLEDREIVQIGNLKIEAILAPGHTTGMTAYLVNDKYLFTGDIAGLKDGKIVPIPAFFDMDTEQAVKSHEIIRHIPTAEYIFTGHWGYADYQTAVQ